MIEIITTCSTVSPGVQHEGKKVTQQYIGV